MIIKSCNCFVSPSKSSVKGQLLFVLRFSVEDDLSEELLSLLCILVGSLEVYYGNEWKVNLWHLQIKVQV